ncbi:prolyl oligopeptidase family serine peptidase [Gemmatimonadota bacterium]
MTRTMNALFRILLPVILTLALVTIDMTTVPAQSTGGGTPFTVDDALDMLSLSVQDITDDGSWLICSVSRRRDRLGSDNTRYGDPTYMGPGGAEVFLMDGRTGERTPLFDSLVQARGFTFAPDESSIAFFLRDGDVYRLHTWEMERGRSREVRLRTEKEISSRSMLEWLPDGSGLLIQLREAGWRERAHREFLDITAGPIIVHDSNDDFLKWDAIRNTGSLTIPSIVDIERGEVRELLPEGNYGSIRIAENGEFLTFTETFPQGTVYARRGGSEYELSRYDLQSGERTVLREQSSDRISATWNEAGDHWVWTDEGDLFLRSVFEEEGKNLTEAGRPYHDGEDTTKVNFSVMRFSPDGEKVLCSTNKGWWLVDIESADVEQIHEFEGEDDERPRLGLSAWSPDGRWLYFTTAARDRWERGLVRFDLQNRRFNDLVKDSGVYRSWQMTEDGSTFYFSASDGDQPNEFYRADASFTQVEQVTELNPWIRERSLTRSELVSYLDTDGEELYGILYYPAGYEEGKKYPLVCEIYETFFDNGFHTNMNLITAAGFFGFRPSVHLVQGYPGESWIKGVTAGINMLIERGLVDPEKLGVHGSSYGGYATALLITQTPRFAAAINISGKVNMVSFYGDSPRLGIRNIQAPEWGQDRIGGSLWEYPERYNDHSAIMFADRIETPLMLISGDLDPNVPARQSMEMYYTMRRLGKEVVWVRYANGAHSPPNSVAEYHDYWNRIIGWYQVHFEEQEKEEGKGGSR